MMLADGEMRLLFYGEGLSAAALALGAAAAVVLTALLAHWIIRARRWPLLALLVVPPVLALVGWLRARRRSAEKSAPDSEPALPWWQILAGLALAAALLAAGLAPADTPAAQGFLAVLLALAAAALVAFFYLGACRSLGSRPLAVLLALRILAVLVLVLLIFKPLLSYEERLSRRTDLLILVDASRSMSVSDWPDTPSRLARAMAQLTEYLDRLRASFNVRLFAFDSRARAVEDARWPEPVGDSTNLARPVRDLLAAAPRADTAALVLLTDGIHNAGGDPVADILAAAPPPVFTVGVGTDLSDASGYQDIAVAAVRAPDEAVVNNITRITVDVDAVGLADRSVEVQVREGDALLAAQPLRLDSRAGPQSVTLTLTPAATGRHTYTVRIPSDPAERRTENNFRDFHLLVTDPRIRVLYIEGVVRPEYKPLKSVLETDPNVELAALVQVRKGEFVQTGSLRDVEISAFPQTLEDMRKFDVYILGDLDRSYFSAAQLANLKTAVSEGRGLLMIGGYAAFGPGGYEGSAVEEMLPVFVGPRTIGQETEKFVLRLTPEGLAHSIFYGIADFFQPPRGGAPAQELPTLKGCTRLGAPKPGASVLAVHPDRAGPTGPLVVLAVQSFGRGRTAAFAADTTYQWYLPSKALGREWPYARFWGQMVRWLASKEIKQEAEGPGVTLLVSKPHYEPGQSVGVRVKVRAEEGRATNFADISAALIAADGKRTPLAFALAPGAVGVYETTIEAPDPGTYKLLVEATKEGVRLGTAEDSFTVGRPNQEFDRLALDRPLLERIAQATGGAYYEPANFADLVQRLRASTVGEDIHREVGLTTLPGAFPILFALFLALLAAEWLLRKHYQLN